jgi:hypothetical protein
VIEHVFDVYCKFCDCNEIPLKGHIILYLKRYFKNMSRRRPAANSATESVALKVEKVGTLKEEIAQYQLAYVKAQLNEIEVAKKREAEIFELKKSVEVRHRNYRRAIECIVPF